jgi:nitrite reductase (NADH) small subunit
MLMNNMNAVMKDNWIEVGRMQEIPVLGSRVVRTGHGNIAVFRAGDDSLFALDDRCPHKGGPLSQGIVYGHTVACPLHNWCIELATGCAVAPDQGAIRRYPVKVEGDVIFIRLSSGE